MSGLLFIFSLFLFSNLIFIRFSSEQSVGKGPGVLNWRVESPKDQQSLPETEETQVVKCYTNFSLVNTEITQNKQIQAGIYNEAKSISVPATHVNSGRVYGTEWSLPIIFMLNHIRNWALFPPAPGLLAVRCFGRSVNPSGPAMIEI